MINAVFAIVPASKFAILLPYNSKSSPRKVDMVEMTRWTPKWTMQRKSRRFLFSLASLCAFNANAADIVFIAATNHAMPFSQFQDGVLTGGLIKDLGEAIGQRMGRDVRFYSVPSKRVPLALANGEADGLCFSMPHWIDGKFNWSKPFLPTSSVLAARPGAPVIKSFSDLADIPVGTVTAYRHPDMEAALGKRFVREYAPFMESNFRKLQAGRMQYAIMERLSFNYLSRAAATPAIRIDLEFDQITARCAFSTKSAIPFAETSRAINSLIEDGSVERMLARYR